VDALHAAARRYCADQAAIWMNRGRTLAAQTPTADGLRPPGEAQAAYARSAFLSAIQEAVEAFIPADFASFAQARTLLTGAGASLSPLEWLDEIDRHAVDEERRLFIDYVRELREEDLSRVEPLPFRRTLSDWETERVRSQLKARWGMNQHYWYPLDRPPEADPPQNAVALAADPFLEPEHQSRLRAVLADLGVSRLFKLLEEGDDRRGLEIDLEFFEPIYMPEIYWTNASFDWVIYASHHESLTIAGERLLPAFQEAVPEWREWVYDPEWWDKLYAGFS
jgi:hypothetical protein